MPNVWKNASGYFDNSTGLYKFGTRSYDASIGRWTQQDPVGGSLGNPNSLNRYVYANDDCVNVTDPNGTDSWYSIFGNCLASAILAPFLWVGAVISGVDGVILAILAVAGITTIPLWAVAIVAAGLGVILGIGLACAIAATIHAT